MMMNNTLAQLRDLKLQGMATAIEEQLCHEKPRIDGANMVRMLGLVFKGIAVQSG
jgi:hypothetical protein